MVIERALILAVFISIVFASTGARSQQGPSFDCRKSKAPVEQLICSNSTLSSLDRQLAIAYGALPKGLSADQREWLRMRQLCFEVVDCVEKLYRERVDAFSALKDFNFADSAEKADAVTLLKTALACPNKVRGDRIESSLTRTTFKGDGETLVFDAEIESVWIKGSAVGDFESTGKRSKSAQSVSVKFSDLMLAIEGDNAVSMTCRSGDCVKIIENGVSKTASRTGLEACDEQATKNVRDTVNYLILSNRLQRP